MCKKLQPRSLLLLLRSPRVFSYLSSYFCHMSWLVLHNMVFVPYSILLMVQGSNTTSDLLKWKLRLSSKTHYKNQNLNHHYPADNGSGLKIHLTLRRSFHIKITSRKVLYFYFIIIFFIKELFLVFFLRQVKSERRD